NISVSVIAMISERLFVLSPAMQRTLPLGSRTVFPPKRGRLNEPVGDHEPADGSNVSVEARPAPEFSRPPTTNTEPLASIVAVWFQRLAFSALVCVQVAERESYTSTLVVPPPVKNPPATRTLPLGNNVAV